MADHETVGYNLNQATEPSDDTRIRRVLYETLASTPWATSVFEATSTLQRNFFEHLVCPEVNSTEARSSYEALSWQLFSLLNGRVRGQGNLQSLSDLPGVIIAINHLGIGHVGYVDNKDHRFDSSADEIDAFPLLVLPAFISAQLHQAQQVIVAKEVKGDVDAIHRKLDDTIFISGVKGETAFLLSEVNAIRKRAERNIFYLAPEGRTSGWANCGGAYDLDEFRAGTFVLGCKTGMPIVPVCQYFDPQRGLDLIMLPPLQLSESDLPDVGSIKEATRLTMQQALIAAQAGSITTSAEIRSRL